MKLLKAEPNERDTTVKDVLVRALGAYFAERLETKVLARLAESSFSEWDDPRDAEYDRLCGGRSPRVNLRSIFLLAEQDDEWAVAARRYFSAESMQQLAQPLVSTSQEKLLAAIAWTRHRGGCASAFSTT